MVSSLSIAAMCATLALSALYAIVLCALVCRGQKGWVRCFLAGMLGFFVPQVCVRLPLLSLPAAQLLPLWLGGAGYTVFLAATAGLAETAGRALVFGLVLKKARTFRTALAAGAGHGWIEAMLLVVPTYVNNLVLSALLNAQGTAGLTALGVGEAAAQQAASLLAGTPGAMFLAAGSERLMAVTFHVLASVLLASFFARGKAARGFLAVWAAHTAFDCLTPLLSALGGAPLALIALETALAVVLSALTARCARLFPQQDIQKV